MKKRRIPIKAFWVTLSILLLFSWWLWKIYLPQREQTYLIPITLTGGEKNLFGLPQKEGLVKLGYIGFVVGFDTLRKNPAWVAYNLKPEWLQSRKKLSERDFKPDPALPARWMADLADFKRSGYDRGHLARQSDMRGRNLQCEQEACYLVNISPQKAAFNQKTWLNLENAVQRWTDLYGEIWVVAGPWFDNQQEYLNHNTEIPDGFYKIVIKKSAGRFAFQCFIFKQSDTSLNLDSYEVSVDSVEKVTGIDFFQCYLIPWKNRLNEKYFNFGQAGDRLTKD